LLWLGLKTRVGNVATAFWPTCGNSRNYAKSNLQKKKKEKKKKKETSKRDTEPERLSHFYTKSCRATMLIHTQTQTDVYTNT